MFRDVLHFAADDYIGMACIATKSLKSAGWRRLRCGGSRLQEFPEWLSMMPTEHFQTRLNYECSCNIHHWYTVYWVQSYETIRAADGLVHRANSALDLVVFEISSEIGPRTVYRTYTTAWIRESSEPASSPNPILLNAERIWPGQTEVRKSSSSHIIINK